MKPSHLTACIALGSSLALGSMLLDTPQNPSADVSRHTLNIETPIGIRDRKANQESDTSRNCEAASGTSNSPAEVRYPRVSRTEGTSEYLSTTEYRRGWWLVAGLRSLLPLLCLLLVCSVPVARIPRRTKWLQFLWIVAISGMLGLATRLAENQIRASYGLSTLSRMQ